MPSCLPTGFSTNCQGDAKRRTTLRGLKSALQKLNPVKSSVDLQRLVVPHPRTGLNHAKLNSVEVNILLGKEMKVKSYPFVPKSTAPLVEGMFWDMVLTDGMHGVGVILQLDPHADKKRGRMFFGGVLDVVTSAVPAASDLASARLVAQGFAHLKAITENGGMIRGVINLQVLHLQPKIMRDIGDSRHAMAVRGYHAASVERGRSIADYPVASTWGYAVPRRIADAIPRKKKPNQQPQTTRGKAPRV